MTKEGEVQIIEPGGEKHMMISGDINSILLAKIKRMELMIISPEKLIFKQLIYFDLVEYLLLNIINLLFIPIYLNIKKLTR